MSAKVDKTSPIGTTSSVATPSTQKVSKFASKVGFVIPKNKLSGSLVPIFRGGTKLGASDSGNEESTKQTQRKTKWGLDLTQDPVVKKGRALAYQTRVDQITKLLKSRTLEVDEIEDSALDIDRPDDKTPYHQSNDEIRKFELLEVEKREAIGEVLKLNPSYKAPLDYKPLLKEDRFSIPVKEYPGYNFIGLIYGPGGDNQKRLEKETGAKIQIYGTKAESREKVEIKPSDGHGIQNGYEELYVNISADTYEKIDAAISVIEILVTSISGNLAAVSLAPVSVSVDNATSNVGPTAVLHQGVVQKGSGPSQSPLHGQFQYPERWFPTGPSNPPLHISPPVFPPRQVSPAPTLQHPTLYLAQANPGHLGPPSILSPMVQHRAPFPHLSNSVPLQSPVSLPDRPMTPAGWSGIPSGQMGQPVGPHSRPPMIPPPSNISTTTMNSFSNFLSGPSNPQMCSTNLNRPIPTTVFSSVGFQMGPVASFSAGMHPTMTPAPSFSGNVSDFTPIKPPTRLGDFTFHPHQRQNTALNTFPRQAFPMPQIPTGSSAPFRLPPFLDANPLGLRSPSPQMGPRNFSLGPQSPNFPGPFPHRPVNHPMQLQQSYIGRGGGRPELSLGPNRYFSGNIPPPSSGGQQVYDPFSPTSVSAPQQLRGGKPAV